MYGVLLLGAKYIVFFQIIKPFTRLTGHPHFDISEKMKPGGSNPARPISAPDTWNLCCVRVSAQRERLCNKHTKAQSGAKWKKKTLKWGYVV
jgi:hypothetical protein